MTFLPIVARELRVASRRRGTYWVRSGAALAVIGLGTWLFLMLESQGPQAVAKGLFGLLTGAATFFCLISGVRYTSDCLSQEKREGTLGLLFLTDLKGYDIVLGKLAATSLNAPLRYWSRFCSNWRTSSTMASGAGMGAPLRRVRWVRV